MYGKATKTINTSDYFYNYNHALRGLFVIVIALLNIGLIRAFNDWIKVSLTKKFCIKWKLFLLFRSSKVTEHF